MRLKALGVHPYFLEAQALPGSQTPPGSPSLKLRPQLHLQSALRTPAQLKPSSLSLATGTDRWPDGAPSHEAPGANQQPAAQEVSTQGAEVWALWNGREPRIGDRAGEGGRHLA